MSEQSIELSSRQTGAPFPVVDIDDMRRAQDFADQLLAHSPVPLLVLNAALRVQAASHAFYDTFQVAPEDTAGRLVYDLGDHQWDIPALRKLLEEVLPLQKTVADFEVRHTFDRLGPRIMLLNARQLKQSEEAQPLIVLSIEDITARTESIEKLRASTEETAAILDALPIIIWMSHDPQCRLITGNRAANALLDEIAEPEGSAAAAQGGGFSFLPLKEDGTEYLPEELPMQRAIATGQVVRDALLDFRHGDGRSVRLLGNAVPLLDEHGESRGAVAAFVDITERSQMEEALRESESFNRSIVESSDDCLKVLELDGRLISMSPQGQRLLGVEDFELLTGKLWTGFWEGEHHQAACAALRAAVEEGSGRMVGFLRTPRGEGRWFDVALSPIHDAEGRPVRVLAVSRDITERRHAELEARFLAEVSQDLVELSEVGKIMQTVGAKLGAHLGLSLVNFVEIDEEEDEVVVQHAWHLPEVPSSLGRYRVAEYFSAEFQAALRAGQPFVVRDTANDPRVDAARFAGLKMGAFVCTPLVEEGRWRFMLNIHHSAPHDWLPEEIALIREVTARLWTRLERVRFVTALHESEARFRAAAGAVSSIIWTNNAAGMMIGEQPGWGGFTGQSQAEYEGHGWARAVHPEDAAATLAAWERAVPTKSLFEFEHRVRRHDGVWRLCSIRAVPVLGEDGEIREWVGVHTDITAQRELEAALVARAEDLARADRSKDEFLAMLAHELRNPLAPLRNASELLKDSNVAAEDRGEAQGILDRSIENMSRMLDDLLDVSRITEGKISLRKTPVSLDTILTAAASLARSGCAAHGQKLSVSLPTDPIFLDADATRLEQVFGNLLNNASKYSGDGSHITLSAQRSGREVIVRVADDGAGIAPELLPHIFDLFVQASRTLDRSHGGLGIGLTLVQRLVMLHGGRIEAHSEGLGRGAEFTVHLPILAEAPTAQTPPMPQPAQETPRRILIVDDNADSARSLATLHKRRGHETRLAFAGPEAVAAAAEFLPDVVLLDIGLPGLDGFEVARQIRAMPAMPKVLIIAMSGYGHPEDRAKAKHAGFDEYLVKPVDLDQLRILLREQR